MIKMEREYKLENEIKKESETIAKEKKACKTSGTN